MQTLGWYLKRLGSMSASEIAWRVQSLVRDKADQFRIVRGHLPGAVVDTIGAAALEPAKTSSRDLPPGAWGLGSLRHPHQGWRDRLIARADALLRHEFSFFDLQHRHLGDPVDWHRDHEADVAAPRRLSMAIDYRDFRETGDCKLVWEPNRHLHLVVLARAWRATGDRRYAEEIRAQLQSWIADNPYGYGMNWRSPLEVAIRAINWSWAIDLARESGIFEGAFAETLARQLALHAWEVERKYSRGSSANNHRIGEAAGVFIVSTCFPHLPGAAERATRAQHILIEEIAAQTYPGGCNRELALGYHLFVLQFFLAAGLVARRTGRDFPAPFWEGVAQMVEFLAALMEGGNELPIFGDAEDGYVLDLGSGGPGDYRWMVQAGAVLFNRPEWRRVAGPAEEALFWAMGQGAVDAYEASSAAAPRPLRSRAFPQSGHYLLQSGTAGEADRISLLFDCGELGFGRIAAHGHADALAVALRAFGRDVLVDPGTYDYFRYPAYRRYFRGTSAHNTVVVDGDDQSTMSGLFLWGQRAVASCTAWDPREDGGMAAGQHDGYTRLADPMRHHRAVELNGTSRQVTITDRLEASGAHEVAVHFHLAESCRVVAQRGHEFDLDVDGNGVRLSLDPGLEPVVLSGSENPMAGWMSRGYHRIAPTTTIVGRAATNGTRTFVCRMAVGNPRQDAALAATTGGRSDCA